MPGMSRYDYVKYYAYTPGTAGREQEQLQLEWVDDFDTLDATRWDQSEDGSVGPLCTFRGANVEVVGGELQLTITEPNPVVPTRPVTFGVDASSLPLSPTDVIYVAGSFNGWCANCHALNDDDGDLVWTTTLDLPLGQHQFQYVVNGWGGAVSQPQLGSSCDFNPCDEWTNYGVSVEEELEHYVDFTVGTRPVATSLKLSASRRRQLHRRQRRVDVARGIWSTNCTTDLDDRVWWPLGRLGHARHVWRFRQSENRRPCGALRIHHGRRLLNQIRR